MITPEMIKPEVISSELIKPERSPAVLARRRPGIDDDAVPVGLRAIEPGDPGYVDVRSTYLRGGSPGIVLQPADVEQVREVLAYARQHPAVPLALRSRGHGRSGRSTNDGGIVIDLHPRAGAVRPQHSHPRND